MDPNDGKITVKEAKDMDLSRAESAFTLIKRPAKGSEVKDLYSYLHNDRGSPKTYDSSRTNLDKLLQSYDRSSMISFVGAGTSKPMGISDWENLMKSLWNVAKSNGLPGDFPRLPDEWPEAAQDIWEHLEGKGKKEIYLDTISQGMNPKNNTTTLTLIKLVLALDTHLTTNFDVSIENAYKFLAYLAKRSDAGELRKKYQAYCLPDLPISRTKVMDAVYYLHGNTARGVYVLKKKDYDTFYPSISGCTSSVNHSLEDFLRACYKEKSIIFVGFSFDDRYLRKFFFDLANQIAKGNKEAKEFYSESGQTYKTNLIQHFLIVSNEILKKRANIVDIFEKNNVYPIIYRSGEHTFVEYLFERLGEE